MQGVSPQGQCQTTTLNKKEPEKPTVIREDLSISCWQRSCLILIASVVLVVISGASLLGSAALWSRDSYTAMGCLLFISFASLVIAFFLLGLRASNSENHKKSNS